MEESWKTKAWNWGDGAVIKSIFCSFDGFGSQYISVKLTAICDFCSRGSSALHRPPQAPGTWCTYIHASNTLKINKINIKINTTFFLSLRQCFSV